MEGYFEFFEKHSHAVVRGFFGFLMVIDVVCVYGAVFDRELMGRVAERFFGAFAGQPVRVGEMARPGVWNWLVFGFVCAVPVVGWVVFEVWFA